MTRGRRERQWVAFSAAVVLCAGCASFRAGTVGPVTNWPPAAPLEKKSISVAVSCRAVVGGKQSDMPQQAIDLYRQRTWASYEESGQFSDVRTGLEPTDLRAEVQVEDRGDPNIGLAVLSGLTFTLLPVKASDELVMRTTFKDAEGNTLATIEKSETVNTWIQMFLVFVMPAKFPTGVVKGVITDLNRATIEDAHARGVF